MPLKPGYSRKTFEANYAELRGSGRPHDQALKASYDSARHSFFKRYPQGLLPQWLAYPDGRRMKPGRKNNPSENAEIAIADWCANNKIPYDDYVRMSNLYHKNSTTWAKKPMIDLYRASKKQPARRANPVPPSRVVQLRNASKLFKNFTGHKASRKVSIDKPEIPDVLLAVGDVDGILYTTVRDGKQERYIHEFRKTSRPLFCVSPDGKQLHMIGGKYTFTERGIEDR